MWADTLLRAERLHLLAVMVWGAASVVAGTALLVVLIAAGSRSRLVRGFAGGCIAVGGLALLSAAWRYHTLALRDYSGAVQLDRFVWFELGVLSGFAIAGLVFVGALSMLPRSTRTPISGPVLIAAGAGVAVVVQTGALAVLDLRLAAIIAR